MSASLKDYNVTTYGNGGKTMVFAHGFGCDQNMWRDVWPAFASAYKIVLFDYIGCGNSNLARYNAEKYSNLNGYSEDLIEICESLHLRDAVFVGHSVSSIIGVLAALKQPHLFSHLILVAPSPRYINAEPDYTGGFEEADILDLLETMEKNYIGWANFLGPVVMRNPERPELTDELTLSFCATDPTMARNFAKATFLSDNREDLSKLNHPVLIMQCSDDLIAPLTVGAFMHSQIKNSVIKVMTATGHCPHMSAPEETISIMQEYLKTYA
jgi:sigma-B regulation protein RsbQ